jgi:branched-chain amino acid transport system ATP-binding protein
MRSLLGVEKIKIYYGKSHIIKDVSLGVKEGEIVTLIGRNGAGKTTTLRSIIGLTPPKSGEIEFYGMKINGLHPFELVRMGIGFVFENRRIFPDLTVRDNLEISAIDRKNRETKWTVESLFESFPILKSFRKKKA